MAMKFDNFDNFDANYIKFNIFKEKRKWVIDSMIRDL